MRLIDADVVEDTLKKCVSNAYKRRDIQCATGVSLAVLQLRNIPEAYSVDRVVEDVRCRCYEMGLDESQTEIVVSEIVKQGGVADDVCEWKYTKEIMDNAEFKVGCNQNALKRGIVPNNFSYHDFKYCPYCGKKIKVVE